ncbi:uncharacterized protein FIESC28_09116 [Fusarium coffeatum]|uniref:Uncharacterized protein n=1 Tax=Fusarium coffeatum TaxID=231269 RepID=A0A366R2Q5_9HYPO|nr:uncharacterized protein FIESC28_09116 [Fusarium coffeatum]RBR11232.1 hypothetical protein FIESC28_09116 [Fusarium coffeatum]
MPSFRLFSLASTNVSNTDIISLSSTTKSVRKGRRVERTLFQITSEGELPLASIDGELFFTTAAGCGVYEPFRVPRPIGRIHCALQYTQFQFQFRLHANETSQIPLQEDWIGTLSIRNE